MSEKIALITGATSGIGEATAKIFAQNNINLILCGRRFDRLEKLKTELSQWVDVEIISFDLTDREQISQAMESLEKMFDHIDILVNNAGNAHGLDSFEEGDLDDWNTMIDLNIKGLLYVTKGALPSILKSQEPHIINVGSIAGYEVYPKGNIYCTSKFAVRAINESLRIDLNEKGVKVSSINPGLVETEFSIVRFKGDEERAAAVYDGLKPLKSIDVARVILFIVQSPVHVNVAEVTLLAKDQASSTVIKRKK